MGTATPLVFRPSLAQRALAALLCVGSWLVGIRALALLIRLLPHWMNLIRSAEAHGEPVLGLWVLLVAAIMACLVGGLILLLAVVGFVLIEGCQVMADELGVAVGYHTLPAPMARWFGAGRLTWRQVRHMDKRAWTFVVEGVPLGEESTQAKPTLRLRFLMVDELERLILLIMEKSPNLS